MQKHSQRRALLDSIVIDHGPQDLLSRVFLPRIMHPTPDLAA
jgi:hypothetical protein